MDRSQVKNDITDMNELAHIAAWAKQNSAFLELVYERFAAMSVWPKVASIHRERFRAGDESDIYAAARSLPRELGSFDFYGDHVALTVRGLSFCPSARPLVEAVITVVQLAVACFRSSEEEHPTLGSADVATQLGLPVPIVYQVGLLVRTEPFLFPGMRIDEDASTWLWEIPQQDITKFAPVKNIDDYLRVQANMLEQNAARAVFSAAQSQRSDARPSAQKKPRQRTYLQPMRSDTLLVTATDVETEAVLATFARETGRHHELKHTEYETFYLLGEVAGATTYLVQSEMGATGLGGSILTVEHSIAALAPRAVVMVGIAFGFDRDKQHLGQVLVARQIQEYDVQKVTTNRRGRQQVLPRGDRVPSSPRLLKMLRAASLDWSQSGAVDFGLLLSGPKLINNRRFRDTLRRFEPEALGGEMEAAGVYATAFSRKAFSRKVDWIAVKAICDWADGSKDEDKKERQGQAAANAADFICYAIRQGGFGSPQSGRRARSPMTHEAAPAYHPAGRQDEPASERDSKLNDQLLRAIDQLGNDRLEIRLGGIAILERIAQDSERDHWPIMELLSAYLRDRGTKADATTQEDVKAALRAIGRRTRCYGDGETERLNLVGIRVHGANLKNARLAGAILIKADLTACDLAGADLQGADLRATTLEGVTLRGARLKGAAMRLATLDSDTNLLGADLTSVDLSEAQLVRVTLAKVCLADANLIGADLTYAYAAEAILNDADLQRAKLFRCNLQSASLIKAKLMRANLEAIIAMKADFTGAYLAEASLRDAILTGARLGGGAMFAAADLAGAYLDEADLEDADLRSADLSGVSGLTLEQIAHVRRDDRTIFPASLCMSLDSPT